MSRSHSLKFALAAVVFLGCDAAPPADSAGSAAVQATPSTEASPDAAGVNKVLDPAGFADPRVRAAYAAAKAQGEFGYGAQWAGQGAPLARELPAAELVEILWKETVASRS